MVQRLEYLFNETYGGSSFIELRIKSLIREKRALNAHISFSGQDKFTVLKIETYGYDLEDITRSIFGDIHKEDLKSNELYNEKTSAENSLLLYGGNDKRIWIECQGPTLDVVVTMNEAYIQSRLNELKFKAKMNLKREIR